MKKYDLKYTKKNFKFWTDEIDNKVISGLDSKFYNSKITQLIENDKLLIGNLGLLSSEYEDVKDLRVRFDELIPFIQYELDKDLTNFINVYELFNNYAKGMKFFYSNAPEGTENLQYVEDSVTFFDTNNNGVWDYVVVDGNQLSYNDFVQDYNQSSPSSNDATVIGTTEIDSCGKELLYVTSEYSFC